MGHFKMILNIPPRYSLGWEKLADLQHLIISVSGGAENALVVRISLAAVQLRLQSQAAGSVQTRSNLNDFSVERLRVPHEDIYLYNLLCVCLQFSDNICHIRVIDHHASEGQGRS